MELYVETSVWNMSIDEEEVNRQKRSVTNLFLTEAQAGRHHLFISPLVLREIAADPDSTHRQALMANINALSPDILDETEDVLRLGHEYVEQRIIPVKYEDDAVHIAFAVLGKLDAIVSWNMAHIVKVVTRRKVLWYNQSKGLHVPDLATPEEVVGRVQNDG